MEKSRDLWRQTNRRFFRHINLCVWLLKLLHNLQVIEMSLDVSEPMRKVQDAILAALEACLSELKRALPHHDASVFSLQNGIFSSFDRTLRLLLGKYAKSLPKRSIKYIICHVWFRQTQNIIASHSAPSNL